MPRKTSRVSVRWNMFITASMRPRPDAAENAINAVLRGDQPAASMRPRPDAAENANLDDRRPIRRIASMRPRPDAAENARRR